MCRFLRRPLVHRFLRWFQLTLAHEIPDFAPADMADTLIGGVFIVFGLHFIQGAARRLESIARRIDFVCAGEFTHGEVFESEMLVKIRQLDVTDTRIEPIRQLRLTHRSFWLIPFKLTKEKLKTHQVSFRKIRVELLSPIDLLLCALYPRRL